MNDSTVLPINKLSTSAATIIPATSIISTSSTPQPQYKFVLAMDNKIEQTEYPVTIKPSFVVKHPNVNIEENLDKITDNELKHFTDLEIPLDKHSLKGAVMSRVPSTNSVNSDLIISSSSNEYSISKNNNTEKVSNKVNSSHLNTKSSVSQRHIPFISVTPYQHGATIIPKHKKSPDKIQKGKNFAQIKKIRSPIKEENDSDRKVAQICRISSPNRIEYDTMSDRKTTQICIISSPSKNDSDLERKTQYISKINSPIRNNFDCDLKSETRITCHKDEMMAAQILASGLGARPTESFEAASECFNLRRTNT